MGQHATAQPTPDDFGIGRLFDAIGDAVVVADAGNGHVVLWNPAAERIFGYTRDRAVGMPLEVLIPERLRQWHRAGLGRYNRTGRGTYIDSHEPIELPAVRSDGAEITIELSLNPVEDAPVAGRFALAVIRDVTERSRAQAELRENQTRLEAALHVERQTSERLRQLSDLRNEFLAMAAHDLRSPTAVIGGFASVLEHNWERLPEEQRVDILRRIIENTQRLANLISDVMQVTHIDSPQFSVDVEPIDLLAIAERIAGEQPGPRVTVEAGDDLPLAQADPQRQEQILRNLISNAMKYSPAESPVIVSVRRVDNHVRVSVADKGIGILAEDVQSLFQKFSRVRQGGESPVEGTGLGLYICKALVEAQGGRIWVESRPGKGSTFSYSVPLA